MNTYNCKDISFLIKLKEWKRFGTSNKTIVFNVLFSPSFKEETRQAYISKQNSKRKN